MAPVKLLEPQCEGCGEKSRADKEALVRAGITSYGPQPEIRASIYCPKCRAANAALVKAARDLPPPVDEALPV